MDMRNINLNEEKKEGEASLLKASEKSEGFLDRKNFELL